MRFYCLKAHGSSSNNARRQFIDFCTSVEMSGRSIKGLTFDLIFSRTVIIQLERKLPELHCCRLYQQLKQNKTDKIE